MLSDEGVWRVRRVGLPGSHRSRLARNVAYLPDLSSCAAMNEAYREVLPRDFPARATVRTGLVAPDGLVEIMLTAAK